MKKVVKPTLRKKNQKKINNKREAMGLEWLQLLLSSGNISNDEVEAINCFETLYDLFPILCHSGDELCALEVSFFISPTPSSSFFP